MNDTAVALIGDIVGSRTYPDRGEAQRVFERVIASINEAVPHREPLAPTVGDEFQGLYATVAHAIQATLLMRLLLPQPFDCRFGIGVGEVRAVETSGAARLQDGSAWWNARDAITSTEDLAAGKNRSSRTWVVGSPDAALTNAYLLCRDEILGGLDERGKRLLHGTVRGDTQTELALAEGISQSAVSQKLARSGVYAILSSTELLAKGV